MHFPLRLKHVIYLFNYLLGENVKGRGPLNYQDRYVSSCVNVMLQLGPGTHWSSKVLLTKLHPSFSFNGGAFM
jgi:hypothetical protein